MLHFQNGQGTTMAHLGNEYLAYTWKYKIYGTFNSNNHKHPSSNSETITRLKQIKS